jgi:tetratricopeptide (TPR) repeat protein
VSADPAGVSPWVELGMVYEANRLFVLAIQCYREAEARQPGVAKWCYREAVSLEELGRVDEAIAAAERASRLDPSCAAAHWNRGNWLLERGDLDAAEGAFRAATEADPRHLGGWTGLARVHLQRDENERALEILVDQEKQHASEPYVHELLASCYRQAGEPERAAAEAARGLGASGYASFPDPWNEELKRFKSETPLKQALLLVRSGEYRRAVPMLEELARGGDEQAWVLCHLAVAYQHTGRLDEAQTTIDRCLGLAPDNVLARVFRCSLRQSRGDLAGALEDVDRALERSPTSGRLHARRGQILRAMGRDEAAIQAWHTALEYDPRSPETWLGLGGCELDLERWSEAAGTFKRASELNPPRAEAFVGLAMARLSLGDLDGAEAAAGRARELAPRDTRALDQVFRALREKRAGSR